MALFSEVPQDEECSANNLKNNKKNSSSSSSSRSSHSDSGMSSGSGSRSISKAVVAAITKLSSSKNLSLSNSRLSLDLSVLSALVTVPATTTSTLDAKKLFISSSLYQAAISVKDRVLRFIKETVLVHGFEGIEDEDEIDEGNGGGRSASGIVCAALKLWTSFVTVTADSLNHQNKHSNRAEERSEDNGEDENEEKEAEGESDGNESEESDMPADVHDLVHVLFECIGCEGASVCGLELDGSVARLAVYESAALCAVECIRLCVVGRFLQVGHWHRLGWAFLASNDGMRRRLLSALNAVIQTTAVHPRFLAYPCLFATDDVLAPIAEQGLMFAVRRLRSTHDGLCGLAIEKNSDKLRALAEINMPETVLPYVLHLLSYHPDFPTSSSIEDEADKRRLKGITKNLRMVTDTLLNSLQDDIGNLSFLLKQVNMISQHYEDSTDCENIGLNFVTILATKILSEKIKTQENVLAYPGDVRLPIELFQLRKGNPKRGQNVLEGLGDVDQAIEKVLKKGGRMAGNKRALGRNVLKSKSVSPKKRTQPSPKVKIIVDRLIDKENNIDDDDGNNGEKGGGSASRAKVPKKAKLSKARLPIEAPERVSSRLQRGGGRPSVSYEEKEESDDEMEGWEAAAAEISLSQSNRLSKGSGTGTGSAGRTGTGSVRESFSGLSGQKRNRKEADDEQEGTEESAKDESADDDDDDDYNAAIRKTILKPKQSSASSSSSSSSSSARIATVNTMQSKNHPISKKEEDYSDRTESSPEKKDDASASPSQSPVSPLSPVVASSNNSPGKKENEHNRHVQGRVGQDEGEERSEEQSEEEEEEEESSEDVRPNRRSKVQPKKPPSCSAATAKVLKPQEQKKVRELRGALR